MNPPVPPASSTSSGPHGLAWLKTKQGKVVAGGAAVVVVVVLALRRGAGATGFTAQPQSGQPDGTLQDKLDQLTGAGGTLSEQGAQLSTLANSVDQLRDLIEARDPANNPSTGTPTTLGHLGEVRANYLEQIRDRVTARNALLRQPRTQVNVAKIHQLEGQLRPLQSAIARVNQQIKGLQGGS